MENASKALIIAGGMLIAILILTLLIYAWGQISDYQTSRDSLADIEDNAKFNEQFANYNRDDVMGYELLSLINQVIDYNETRSTDTIHENNEKYPPVTLTITMGSETNRSNLTYNNIIQLFSAEKYEESDLTKKTTTNTRPSFRKNIIDRINRDIGDKFGSEEAAQGIVKSISSIFRTEDDIENEAERLYNKDSIKSKEDYKKILYKEMIQKYNSYLPSSVSKLDERDINKLIIDSNKNTKNPNDLYNEICAYYEWMQFKKGIFECTNIEYDYLTSRVIKIDFSFTGDIK